MTDRNNDNPATPHARERISVEEWLRRQGHPVPGWGVPNASVDPQAFAEWCDREGVINEFEFLL